MVPMSVKSEYLYNCIFNDIKKSIEFVDIFNEFSNDSSLSCSVQKVQLEQLPISFKLLIFQNYK